MNTSEFCEVCGKFWCDGKRHKTTREEVEALGLVIDEGNLIAGPFIPDGRTRIYEPETYNVRGEGQTLEEALASMS